MDIDEEETFLKSCYTCDEPVLDNLNIVYNFSNSMLILWNKYQIFVYKDTELQSPDRIIVPEFQIQSIVASNSYLLCIDYNGNTHLTPLKFKNSTQKRFKTGFHVRDQGIKIAIRYKEDHVISLKYDTNSFFLCINRLNSEFRLERKIILLYNNEHSPLGQNADEKYLLTSLTIEENLEHLKKTFIIIEEKQMNSSELIVLSFDKFTLYGCLYCSKLLEDEITLVKLFSCPAEICDIEIIDSVDMFLIIGLKMGTIIRLSLNDITKPPDIVHLNTALYRMMLYNNSLIYSNGATMWKSENTFSNHIKFTQLFVKNSKDFIKCREHIICTTFTKLIYKFTVEDQSIYLLSNADEYCPAEVLLNNSQYINRLFKEIDNNNEIVKKLKVEEDIITALSLSNREDIVNKAIESTIMVFEHYNEVKNEIFTLTEEIMHYFKEDSWLLLVKISNSNIFNALNEVLSQLLENIRIYITISSPYKIIKTTVIKTEEPLKTVQFLIPFNADTLKDINIIIKIVVNIPGVLDIKQTYSVLYRKIFVLTSEHFIKINNNSIQSLKKPKQSNIEFIQEIAFIQHGNTFTFTDIFKTKDMEKEWSFYVKLPNDYEQVFKADKYCKYLNCIKNKFLSQQWSSEKFLKTKNDIILEINSEKYRIKIQDDGFSNPLLKVSGNDARTALDLRNFFANIIYNDYENYEPGKEFIPHTFYSTAENLQIAVKNCLIKSSSTKEILPLLEQFEKNIIGALPL